MANERWIWDATANLEALGAAEVALWVWEPEKDRLRLTGATRALGLGPLAPDCSSAALRALAFDKKGADEALRKAAYRAYRRAKRRTEQQKKYEAQP